MNPATLKRSYYPSLDGLRGIAIILVICCHYFDFIPFMAFGWIGVDIFFVLSGFLITDILLTTRNNKNFLQNFYIHRALRIFPLYYGVVLIFFLLSPIFNALSEQYIYYQDHQLFTWLHLQNWLYIIYQKPSDFLLLNHFWSLSVEEQFYLFWPLIILICKSHKKLAAIALFIMAGCILLRFSSWIYYGNGYTNFYFQYMTRLDGLCIGSLIAIWRTIDIGTTRKKVFKLSGLILISHFFVFVLSRTLFPGLPHFSLWGYTSISSLFAVLLIVLLEKNTVATRTIFQNKPLRSIGKISYGLYVFHWPVLVLFKLYLLQAVAASALAPYTDLVIAFSALLVALGISALSYHFFEKKILELKGVLTSEGYFSKIRQRILLFFRLVSSR